MAAVLQLTQRAIVLANGSIAYVGSPQSAVDRYLEGSGSATAVGYDVQNARRTHQGTGEATITFVRFRRVTPRFQFNEPISLSVRIRANANLPSVRVGVGICRQDRVSVGGGSSGDIAGLGQATNVR